MIALDTRKIRTILKQKGMSYEELGNLMNCSRKTIWNKLNNKIEFNIKEVNKIAFILGVEAELLIKKM